ncbi:TPA: LysR family transcriptional regulator, partial [Escherichia coli]|nr:LysR family transcriptional regulator [Escherichia coli]
VIYRAIKTHYPQLLLRNPPIGGAENQLCQFQTDLITDNMFCTGP